MEDHHFLKDIFDIDTFSREDFNTIIHSFKRVEFPKNSFLLKEGEVSQHYWFVESGWIRAYVVDYNGSDISSNFYTSHEIVIDWPSFFLRSPTRENFQAITDCTCWQLDFNTFQEHFHSLRPFREQGRTTLVRSYFTLKKHTVSLIADRATDRYLRLLEDKPKILQHVPLKHIASYLGITDTSLSRIRKEIHNP